MVDYNGRIKSSRTQPTELLFDFKICSTGSYFINFEKVQHWTNFNFFLSFAVCLDDCVLAFHSHGLQGRSFSNNEIVQEITDPSRCFKVIGADQTIVLESRPTGSNTNTDTPSNLYILTGHENSY